MVYCSYSWLEAWFCRACCQSLDCFSCNEENPYPLVFECLRVSGVTAFLQEVQRLISLSICDSANVSEWIQIHTQYPFRSVPQLIWLAAITINILTMATVHTLGISVDFSSALLYPLLHHYQRGASGVAGGSLLLIPVACSLLAFQMS